MYIYLKLLVRMVGLIPALALPHFNRHLITRQTLYSNERKHAPYLERGLAKHGNPNSSFL